MGDGRGGAEGGAEGVLSEEGGRHGQLIRTLMLWQCSEIKFDCTIDADGERTEIVEMDGVDSRWELGSSEI